MYYNPECKECTKNRSSKWSGVNPERRKDLKSKYDTKPERRDKRREDGRLFRERGGQKLWYKEHPESLRKYADKRKSKEHEITDEEWLNCKKFFNHSCAYCGLHINEHYKMRNGKLIRTDLHKEHVEHEGSNKIDNCIPSCHSCNSSKWKYSLEDWYSENNKNYTKERYERIISWLNSFNET